MPARPVLVVELQFSQFVAAVPGENMSSAPFQTNHTASNEPR
jgi:hypothetical protein